MAVTAGTRLGPYEVVAPIGAGGMGEVYRARDTRLAREVAIKIVPPELAQRFEREARAISQLNHPNICTLYDVGENYLVMELLDGETLADKLAKGPLPLDQVLRYGVQIADALDKAHRAGIVHRDLKPGNIMITKSGSKLLDFGLAKSGPVPAASGIELTERKPLTAEGTIIGTFQYMAPEQLEGQPADARTDIFAFGTVLYEMATGKRAFEGKTRTSLIAAIVSGEPKPMSQLQPLAPLAFENIVRKCIAKNPDDRWQCAADLQWELHRIQEEAPEIAKPARTSRVAWGVAIAALIAAAIFAAMTFRPPKPQRPIRFTVTTPAGWTFAVNYNMGPPAISPDGRYMTFPATEDGTARVMLWVRDFSNTELFSLPGTDGAGFPFWSPDSKSIAFFGGGYLKRVELGGGSPQTLCPVAFGRGGTWSQNNEILFAPTGNSGLLRVSASGGTPREVTKLDTARGEVSNRWPLFLPDGKHFLFLIRTPSKAGFAAEKIHVASLDAPASHPILDVSSNIVYVDPGRLLYMRDRTLMVQRFNTRSLELEGDATVITTQPMQYHASGFGLFSASRNGTVLAYGSGVVSGNLEFFDRNGHSEPATPNLGAYLGPRMSRDNRQILYGLPDATSGTLDLWLYDIDRRVARRVTFHPRDDFVGTLTPDGKNLIFSSNRLGFPTVFMKPVDGSQETSLLPPSNVPEFVEDISPDGRTLLFRRISSEMQNDLFALTIGTKAVVPLARSEFNEVQPTFSPSGKWVAYVSNESGRYQIYVTPFPTGGERVQVTADGGMQPTWRGDEKELFYLAPGGRMMAVPIDASGGEVKPGVPVHLFDVSVRPSRDEEREYDVSRDGRRFVVNTAPAGMRSIPITVVVNWQNDLEHK